MEKLKKLPKSFFEKVRPQTTPNHNSSDEIIPIKWSKEVLSGQKRALVKLKKNK